MVVDARVFDFDAERAQGGSVKDAALINTRATVGFMMLLRFRRGRFSMPGSGRADKMVSPPAWGVFASSFLASEVGGAVCEECFWLGCQ